MMAQRWSEQTLWEVLNDITDPEVPVLTILDLGIVREVNIINHPADALVPKHVQVKITPTYSGCPAMDTIKTQIYWHLTSFGIEQVNVELVLSPAWTTDWMRPEAHEKLKAYGMAPPQRFLKSSKELESICCPRCNSTNVECIAQFGATSCKALYKCLHCLDPFEHFKCH